MTNNIGASLPFFHFENAVPRPSGSRTNVNDTLNFIFEASVLPRRQAMPPMWTPCSSCPELIDPKIAHICKRRWAQNMETVNNHAVKVSPNQNNVKTAKEESSIKVESDSKKVDDNAPLECSKNQTSDSSQRARKRQNKNKKQLSSNSCGSGANTSSSQGNSSGNGSRVFYNRSLTTADPPVRSTKLPPEKELLEPGSSKKLSKNQQATTSSQPLPLAKKNNPSHADTNDIKVDNHQELKKSTDVSKSPNKAQNLSNKEKKQKNSTPQLPKSTLESNSTTMNLNYSPKKKEMAAKDIMVDNHQELKKSTDVSKSPNKAPYLPNKEKKQKNTTPQLPKATNESNSTTMNLNYSPKKKTTAAADSLLLSLECSGKLLSKPCSSKELSSENATHENNSTTLNLNYSQKKKAMASADSLLQSLECSGKVLSKPCSSKELSSENVGSEVNHVTVKSSLPDTSIKQVLQNNPIYSDTKGVIVGNHQEFKKYTNLSKSPKKLHPEPYEEENQKNNTPQLPKATPESNSSTMNLNHSPKKEVMAPADLLLLSLECSVKENILRKPCSSKQLSSKINLVPSWRKRESETNHVLSWRKRESEINNVTANSFNSIEQKKPIKFSKKGIEAIINGKTDGNLTPFGTKNDVRETDPKKKENRRLPRVRKVNPMFMGIKLGCMNEGKMKSFDCEVCNVQDVIANLKDHLLDNPDKHDEKIEMKTQECKKCQCFTIFQNRPNHFRTDRHISIIQKTREEEQVESVKKMAVLCVDGIPDVPDKFNGIHKLFGEIGRIEHLTVTGSQALIEFAQPSCVKKVLAIVGIELSGTPLILSEKYLEKKYAMSDIILDLLTDPLALESWCRLLAKEALAVYNDPDEIHNEKMLMETLYRSRACCKPQKPYLFGSRFNGLALPCIGNPDLDIFVGCDAVFSGIKFQSPRDQKSLVYCALQRFLTCADVKVLRTFPNARVPIITFKHIPTDLNCDLSFRNGLSVINSEFVKYMLTLDERVRPMVLFVKFWLYYNNLKGIISSYCATIMVFHYIAQLDEPVLPTLHWLRLQRKSPFYRINEWDCSFPTNVPWTTKNKSSIVELLYGFFRFAADYDYKNNIMFPLMATNILRLHLLRKEDFAQLPLAVRQRYYLIESTAYDETAQMCIMDPFDFSHNLSRRVRTLALDVFIQFSSISASLLGEALKLPPEVSIDSKESAASSASESASSLR